ncbi:ABC transporter permease [Haladaptatus salinisoli]|uniref:ABC transporter permease n=1 Tax=Haladaptatus salinisoli TaxID=2884876 RepID=UPI001D0A5CA1|nr:ABC transporter permease [Haladaptatus salinisoli]
MSGIKDELSSVLRQHRDRHHRLYHSLGRGWSRFTNHSLGVAGLVILTGLTAMAIFAPLLAPHPLSWKAPTNLGNGGGAETLAELGKQTLTHPAPPKFGDPYFAPLGTTQNGNGVFTQLVYGARTTLYVGFAAGLLSSLVGVPLGLVSGFYGDTWIDEAIQRIVDVMYGLPFLPLVIVLVTLRGVTTTNIIIAIAVKSWLNNAIVIRGQTLTLKERSYVEAARVSGASDLRIIFRHILPNVLPLAFVYLAQDAAFAILTQASLAFIGLAPSNVSWGWMLQWVKATGHVYDALWWMVPPGIMIMLVAASFYFVGYSLEDVMNPQRREA